MPSRRTVAISDEDMSEGDNDLEVVPSAKRGKKAVKYTEPKEDDIDDEVDDVDVKADDAAEEEEEDDAEEDDGEAGEEFVVERIVSHMIDQDGKPRFEVKWEGFDDPKDLTWEPEENLVGTADAILEEYLERIGGVKALYAKTEKALKNKKRGRPSTNSTPSSAKKARVNGSKAPDSEEPKARKPAPWKPPAGSWEDHIDQVDMTRDETGELIVWLTWKNGEKSQHKAQQAYTRAPQKMLKFYESKINFTTS